MKTAGLLLVMAFLAIPATALAQDDLKGEIEATNAKFLAAYNAGDVDAVAAQYTEDAMLLPPNSAPVNGAEAIHAFWTEALAPGVTVELNTKEVYGGGDTATEIGVYVLTAEDGSHVDHGHYTVIFKRVDGEWKLLRDMFHSDMSAER